MITIMLPPELEQAINAQAQQQGTTPETLVVDSLQKLYLPLDTPVVQAGGTLAEYWADYIGTVDSRETTPGGANLSQNTGDRFAELMQQK